MTEVSLEKQNVVVSFEASVSFIDGDDPCLRETLTHGNCALVLMSPHPWVRDSRERRRWGHSLPVQDIPSAAFLP